MSADDPADLGRLAYLTISGNRLGESLDELTELYQEAFCGPPRWERSTAAEVTQLLSDLKTRGARVIAAQSPSGPLEGYALGLPLADTEFAQEWRARGITTQSYYLAHLAVRKRSRRKGIARELVRRLIASAAPTFAEVIVRCRVDAEAVRALLTAEGFQEKFRYQATTGGVPGERIVLQRSPTKP